VETKTGLLQTKKGLHVLVYIDKIY